jgi:PPM family protein phosphatase
MTAWYRRTESEARAHPQRSVVLEALDGVERPLRPLQRFQAQVGDRLLLCSDGVTDYLSDAEVADLLKTSDASVAVRRLIGSALARGSRDNITAVIADIVTRTRPRDGWLDVLPVPSNVK